MNKICFILAIILLSFGCSDDSKTKKVNYLQNFQGITERDEFGALIGTVDSTDWNLHDVDGIFDFPTYVETKGSVDQIVPTPFTFSAFPNPTSSTAIFKVNALQECEISVWLINETGNCVAVIAEKEIIEKGIYQFGLNFENISSGLYRCLYYLMIDNQAYWGWGDILKE
jgi:hypothetical protein